MDLPRSTILLIALAVLAGCSADEPVPLEPEVQLSNNGGYAKATGGGHYVLTLGNGTDLDIQFAFTATQTGADGAAGGRFHHQLDFFGDRIRFHGDVTCLTVDPANGRAWIGGVVTQNQSVAEPWATGEIFQPGKDIWFRVLDSGNGPSADDRTTFVGFEGGAGIITSEEYCEVQPWPDDNERTWPVTGQVKVH